MNERFRFVMGLVAVVMTLSLFGCARFQPHPVTAEKTQADYEQRTLTSPELKAFIQCNAKRDVSAVQSWDLDALTLVALYYNPDLDVARAKWAVARAGKVTAGERPNPTVSVTPGYDTTTHTPSPWIVTASLDIPIETAGKRGYRIAQANQLSDAARLSVASVAWQVRSQLRKSFIDLYAARETQTLLLRQQTLHEQIVKSLEAQLGAGAVSTFEVTQARLAFNNAQLALRDAEKQNGEALAQLAAALGVPARALDGANFSFTSLAPPSELPLAEVRRQALLNRADILGSLAEYAASESALRLEIAKQYPDVHFNPGYEFDQGDNKWTLGLSITLPVLSQNQGAIAEAEARRTQAAAQFTALQARVIGDIDRALASYRVALAKSSTANTLLENAQKQQRTTRAMLDAGEISRFALSTTELEVSLSVLARLDALAKAQQAWGDLENALQSPLGLPESLWLGSPREQNNSEKNHE